MTTQHPLINRVDSKHYDTTDEPAIKRFERVYTVGELLAWAKITLAKYRDPARRAKGQIVADVRKAQTYEDYYNMLHDIAVKFPHMREMTAEKAYAVLGFEFEY